VAYAMEQLYQEGSMINLSVGKNLDSPIAFKAGSVIFAEGETSKYLFILKKGQVRLLKTRGQHLSIVKNCQEKELLNEVSVLTSKLTEFGAIAITDIELVLIEQKDILSIINSGPGWIPDIFKTLCERLISTLEIIEEHHLGDDRKSDMVLHKEDERKYLNALSEYKIQ
jgi:CRP/FNR family transcriptional regulator